MQINFTNSLSIKIFLYDLEPKFSKHHKSTCNLIIERDYKNIDIKLDIVLINSVIQYINIKNLEELISYFYKKNVSHIVINDIPKSNRILEFFFIFFRNPNTSLLIYKNIFKNLFFQNYLENKFFFHKRTDLYNLSKNIGFNVNYYKNFYSNNTRYTLILSLDNLGLKN